MMGRRNFLKLGIIAAVTSASTAAGSNQAGENPTAEKLSEGEQRKAAPCGLFCGACSEFKKARCHGCGCECGKCIASSHSPQCSIYKCSKAKNIQSCGDCNEFACTSLIMHACDPIWRTHAPCLENLRRRKAIGTKAWVAEQNEYWADEDKLRKSHFMEAKCQELVRELRNYGYKKPY